MYSNELTKHLNLKYPLVVAPMAGGSSSPELVISSSETGALGSIGAAYSTVSAIQEFFSKVRAQTKNPIAINLFIPHQVPVVSELQIENAIQATEIFWKMYNLPKPILQPPYEENFDEQFEMVLKLRPEVLSFVFGTLKPDYVKAAQKEKIYLIGTATTFEEARELQDSGVGAITLQGFEAGGHRGLFQSDALDSEISLTQLLQSCRTKITKPLIAAGGIMTSQDIRTAFHYGAQAVQMGTAFLACAEAGTSAPYKKILLETPQRKTKLTRAFSGRLARGIENDFMTAIDSQPHSILPFPIQNKFTRDIRNASAKKDSSDCLALWAGSGHGNLWTGSAKDLIEKLFKL